MNKPLTYLLTAALALTAINQGAAAVRGLQFQGCRANLIEKHLKDYNRNFDTGWNPNMDYKITEACGGY